MITRSEFALALNGIILGFVITHTYVNTKFINQILRNKFNSIESRISKLEDFRINVYEKNFLVRERRHWDEDLSEESYDSDESETIDE